MALSSYLVISMQNDTLTLHSGIVPRHENFIEGHIKEETTHAVNVSSQNSMYGM